MMYAEIGAFDAKTNLSKLLQEVMQGQHFTITIRGKPIADLVPSKNALPQNTEEVVRAIQKIKKVKGISTETLSQWIQEGRQ